MSEDHRSGREVEGEETAHDAEPRTGLLPMTAEPEDSNGFADPDADEIPAVAEADEISDPDTDEIPAVAEPADTPDPDTDEVPVVAEAADVSDPPTSVIPLVPGQGTPSRGSAEDQDPRGTGARDPRADDAPAPAPEAHAPAPEAPAPAGATVLRRVYDIPAPRAGRSARQTAVQQSKRAERIARRAVTSLVVDREPVSDQVPLVQTLRGTPYARPVEAAEPSEDHVRRILTFASELGKLMLRSGAGTDDVQTTVYAACAASGLQRAQVDLTYQSLTLHYTTLDGRPLTVLAVNRGESVNFARLRAVHSLVSDLVDGQLEFEDAEARLDAITTQRKPFPNWLVSMSWGILAAGLIVMMGGGWVSIVLGGLTTLFADRMGRLLARTGMPLFFITFFATSASMLVAMTAFHLELIARPQYMVAAGLVVLLPTMTLLSAVQDALTNFPLTAAGRMINVLLTFAAIVSGVAVGLMVGRLLNMREIQVLVEDRETGVLIFLVGVICAGIVATAGGVAQQVTKRLLPLAAIVGIAGYLVLTAAIEVGLGNVIACFLGGTAVAFLARPLALRFGSPPIVLIIPGIFPLLQGLSIFAGAYQMVSGVEGASLADASAQLLQAIIANAAIGVGAVMGNVLSQPVMKRRKRPDDRAAALSS